MIDAEIPLLPPAAQTPAATLIGLVQRFSPSGQEPAAVEWLVQRMQALGFERAFADAAGNAVGIRAAARARWCCWGISTPSPARSRCGWKATGCTGAAAWTPRARWRPSWTRRPACSRRTAGRSWWWGRGRGARFGRGRATPPDSMPPHMPSSASPASGERVTLGYKGSAWASLTLRRTLAHTASQARAPARRPFNAGSTHPGLGASLQRRARAQLRAGDAQPARLPIRARMASRTGRACGSACACRPASPRRTGMPA